MRQFWPSTKKDDTNHQQWLCWKLGNEQFNSNGFQSFSFPAYINITTNVKRKSKHICQRQGIHSLPVYEWVSVHHFGIRRVHRSVNSDSSRFIPGCFLNELTAQHLYVIICSSRFHKKVIMKYTRSNLKYELLQIFRKIIFISMWEPNNDKHSIRTNNFP
jgi:hypothetical protein